MDKQTKWMFSAPYHVNTYDVHDNDSERLIRTEFMIVDEQAIPICLCCERPTAERIVEILNATDGIDSPAAFVERAKKAEGTAKSAAFEIMRHQLPTLTTDIEVELFASRHAPIIQAAINQSTRELAEALKETVKELRTQADLDYCVGCAEASTNYLLMGEDAHIERGTFSKAHLNAHRTHNERMSRHKHFHEAANMITSALKRANLGE